MTQFEKIQVVLASKTGLSKLFGINDLSNGRSWTEERVRHSKYFPNWN